MTDRARLAAAAVLLAATALAPRLAAAQVIAEKPAAPFPDPSKFERGFFVEGNLGASVFVGRLGQYADPGPAFSVRLGYDVLRWLAVDARVGGELSAVDAPAPFDHQVSQLFVYAAEVRLQLQLKRIGLWAAGGGGAALLGNNLLEQLGVTNGHRLTGLVTAGVGFDFHTLNRHYSVGVSADYGWLAQFQNSHALTFAAYLRYTWAKF
jgi:hypothetical protein